MRVTLVTLNGRSWIRAYIDVLEQVFAGSKRKKTRRVVSEYWHATYDTQTFDLATIIGFSANKMNLDPFTASELTEVAVRVDGALSA